MRMITSMNGGRLLSLCALCCALAVLALAPVASAAATRTVSGQVQKPEAGMLIAAVGPAGEIGRAKVGADGRFALKVPARKMATAGLLMLHPNGSNAGQVLLAKRSRRGFVRMTGSTRSLGSVRLQPGFATLARDLRGRQFSRRSSVPLTRSGRPAAISSLFKAVFAPKPKVIATCVRRYWEETEEGDGFELIDNLYRQVWGWNNMTQAQFDAITLRPTWIFWLKNSPRETIAKGFFVRSPECPNDGEYTWKRMYGWNWLNVTNFVSLNEPVDEGGLITRSVMWKYQTFTFAPGSYSSQLTAPDGKKYVMVTRDPTRTTDVSTLPAGWTMSPTYTLGRELKIELFGKETENFRTSNGDSFQGPMPAGFDLSQYAK